MSLNLTQGINIQVETLDCCPVCHSKHIEVWCQGWDRFCQVTRQSFTYSKCRKCRAVFQSTRPIESEIHKFYPENYVAYKAVVNQKADHSLSLIGDTRWEKMGLALLKQISSQNGRIKRYFPDGFQESFQQFYELPHSDAVMLDFGCGSGKYLDISRKVGWQTIGIDFSQYAIEQVRQNGHQGFLMSPTVWDNIDDESIDMIRMNHVLEHIYDPKPVLNQLFQKLKPGGCFHMALPNPESLGARLFRSRWFSLDCPRHIILYPPKLIQSILSAVGFTSFTLLHETLTKDLARSWGYVLIDRGLISHEALDNLIYDKDVKQLLYTPARLLRTLQVADRFHLFFYKPACN
jgi:SAM-dependent methyltransferase